MKSITQTINENAVSSRQSPEVMKTHKWEFLGPSRYTTHFRCFKCGAEGIANGTTYEETPEFYENGTYKNLTCEDIIIKNIIG